MALSNFALAFNPIAVHLAAYLARSKMHAYGYMMVSHRRLRIFVPFLLKNLVGHLDNGN
jgi:hypothetical protein